MAKKASKSSKGTPLPSDADVGAAFMAWYSDAISDHPEGLITQAQAARILGISRMALSRLVARGHIQAVYFPKEPDVVGVSVGADDPTWLKLLAWLGRGFGLDDVYDIPQACYVSFGDVVDIWERGDAKKRCARDWNEIITSGMNTGSIKSSKKSSARLREILKEKQRIAVMERESRKTKS